MQGIGVKISCRDRRRARVIFNQLSINLPLNPDDGGRLVQFRDLLVEDGQVIPQFFLRKAEAQASHPNDFMG